MRVLKRAFWLGITAVALLGATLAAGPAQAAGTAHGFNPSAVSDMTGFDPSKFENPSGDVIKIGVLAPFSGDAAAV